MFTAASVPLVVIVAAPLETVKLKDGKVAAADDVPTHLEVVVTAVKIFAAVSETLTELVALDPLAK